MAIIIDADGNLVDTENRIQFPSEYVQYTPDYFGANSPMLNDEGNARPSAFPGDFNTYYDPAFGITSSYITGDTSYPQTDILPFYKKNTFDEIEQVPNLQRALGNPRFSMEPTGIMKKAPVDMVQQPLKNLDFDTSYGVANQADVEDENEEGPKGLAAVIEKLRNFTPIGIMQNLFSNMNDGPNYQRYSPGTTVRNGIVSIDGVNTPYGAFAGDFFDPRTGLNRFDRARNRFNKTGSMKDLFGSSRTLKDFLDKRKQVKTGQIISDPGSRGSDRDDTPAGFGRSAQGNFTNQFEGGDPGQFL